jgi:hypothetical protein
MKFNCEDLIPGIPKVQLPEESKQQNGYFRISLSDFLPIWQGFPLQGIAQKRNRLESIFNADYFDEYIVVSDSISIEKIRSTNFSQPSPKNGSGFIYVYTFEDNVLAGARKEGFLWWEKTRYEPKLKIGRTEQHPFYRIERQLDKKANIPEPPILMAILWTELVATCERDIHYELTKQGKRLSDDKGRQKRGGVEWFKDELNQSMPTIYNWINHYRNPVITNEEIPLSFILEPYNEPIANPPIAPCLNTIIFEEKIYPSSADRTNWKKKSLKKEKQLKKFSVSHIYVYEDSIKFSQQNGFFNLNFSEIYAVKFRSGSEFIVRLRNGERYVFDFFNLRGKELDLVAINFQNNLILIRNEGVKTYISPTANLRFYKRFTPIILVD